MKFQLPVLVVSVVLGLCLADPACDGVIRTSCTNIYTAQRCNMVPQCLSVWKQSKWVKYRTDLSADCTFCRHLAKSTRNDKSASLICSTFPGNTSNVRSTQFDSNKCLEVAMKLIDLPSEKDNEIALCNVLTHCRSHTFIGHLNFGSTLCDDCKKVIQDIRALIADNATSNAIISMLDELVCSKIPEQFQSFCKETIKVHVPPILDLINRQISAQDICALLGLCPEQQNMSARIADLLSPDLFTEKTDDLPPATHVPCPKEDKFSWISRPSARGHPKWTSLSRLDGVLLTLTDKPSGAQCEAVLNQIRISLKDPAQQAKIKEDIDKEVCETLPSFLRTMCNNAVNEHFNEMMEHLDKVDLKKVCTMFGMPPDSLQTPSATLPGLCQICKIVVAKVVDMTLRGATEREITEALDKVCRVIPSSYEQKCENFVEQFGAKIVTALITGTAPELVCVALGLCGPILPPPKIVVSQVQQANDAYCDTCKLLVTMIEHQLVQNQTEQEVEQLIKNLCNVFPSSYSEECKNLVDQYLPMVIQFLMEKMNPEDVCEAIQLCPSKLGANPYPCGSSHATAAQRNTETLCKHSSGTAVVEEFTKRRCQTMDMDEICGSLELASKCGKSKECLNRQMFQYLKLVSQHTQEALQSPRLEQNCTVCEQLTTRWRLHKTLFGAPIVNKDTCLSYTAKADRDQCNLVVKSVSDIFQLLTQKATDIKAMCKSLGLCQVKITDSNTSPPVGSVPQNIGAQVLACSEGPVFWCASKRNAEACGTVNFCNALSWFGDDTKPKPTTLLEVDVDIFGVNTCAWGSAYWCQNEETARRCGALDHCQTVVWRTSRPRPEVGTQQVRLRRPSDPCTWGPGYYCSSPEKALRCGQQYVNQCWQLAQQKNRS